MNVELTPGLASGGTNKGYCGYSADHNYSAASGSESLYRRGYSAGHTSNNYTKVNNRDDEWSDLESYTRIEIYNTGENVNADNAGLGDVYNGGVVSWGNLPNRIVFDQYKMGWNTSAAQYLMDAYFGNTYTARWQNGTRFSRANVTFSVNGASGSGFQTALANALGNANEQTGWAFTVESSANFGNTTATMNIILAT